MTEAQIKHMVNRFLGWKLPENFSPDAGISFKAAYNENTPYPAKHEPVGTNLFTATQAEAMVRHMIEGISPAAPSTVKPDDMVERVAMALENSGLTYNNSSHKLAEIAIAAMEGK